MAIEMIGYHGVRVSESGGVQIGPAHDEGDGALFAAYQGISLEPVEALRLLDILEKHREQIQAAHDDDMRYQEHRRAMQAQEVA